MTKSCWAQRTKLEIALICTVLITMGVITTLAILQIQSEDSSDAPMVVPEEVCDSQTCITEALEILHRIDPSIDPCDDFYAFSCNNLPKMANKQYGPFANIIEDSKLKIEEMYSEPIRNPDHNMVKIQKRLYQACMNETAIEMEAFRTLQAALKAAGGWPVVEGPSWNKSGFDWLETTYKFRQLGYSFSSFLDLNIVPDPRHGEKYIFEVSIPDVKDVYSKFFNSEERNGFMTDVAVAFGAEMHFAIGEMTETLDFLLDLQWKRGVIADNEQLHRATVEDIQRRHGTIKWLDFINRIAGRTARISQHDFILFPSESAMDEWFGSLLKASERAQANYMMWRVVQEALPYLTQTLLNARVKPRLMLGAYEEKETRSEYCIKEVRKRFSPSPIDIMFLRKYLPEDKKEQAEELMENIQSELLQVVKQIEWMDAADKRDAEERIHEVNVVIGAPGDYFDDEILDDTNYNFNKTTSNNFLKLLSEAEKNQRSRIYNLINKSTRSTRLVRWGMTSYLPSYDPGKNQIDIPATILQGEVFDEKRPQYLNYGIMGVTMKNFLFGNLESSSGWSNKTAQSFVQKLQCLINGTHPKVKIPDYLVYQPVSHILGLKVSHAAYKNWARENEEESPLFALDYTPNQLFWISSGYIFCHYTNPLYDAYLLNATVRETYSAIVSKFINSNAELARDFDCPVASELNYEEQCKIF